MPVTDSLTQQQRHMERTVTSAIVTAVSVVILALALHYAYKNQISPLFAYQGARYRTPDPFNMTASILISIVAALALPRTVTKPSDFILWIVFVVAALPAILVSQYAPILTPDRSTIMGANVAGTLIFCRILVGRGPRGLVPSPGTGLRKHFWAIVIAYSAVVYTLLVAFVGIQFRYLSFADVYDVRSEFTDATVSIPVIGYLLPLQYNVINPMLMVHGIYRRKALMFMAGAGGQIVMYMTMGAKSILLSIAALLAAAWLFRKQPVTGARIMTAVAAGTIGAVVIDKILGSFMMTSLFVRRFLVVSGVLSAVYVAIFADRPKTNFSDSLLPFLTNPYQGGTPPSHLVGAIFVGNIDTSANVSLFGHGFLSYGYIGMYVEGAALALVLWLIDDASHGLSLPIASLIVLMPAIAISSASIFTAMLTHGLFGAIILLMLMPREDFSTKAKCAGESAKRMPQPTRR